MNDRSDDRGPAGPTDDRGSDRESVRSTDGGSDHTLDRTSAAMSTKGTLPASPGASSTPRFAPEVNGIEPDEDGVIPDPHPDTDADPLAASRMGPYAADNASFEASREALEGEPGIPSVSQARARRLSRKAVVSLLMITLAMALAAAAALSRATAKDPDDQKKLASDLPSAAAVSTRKLDLGPPVPPSGSAHVVPAIRPQPDEVEPIGVRRTGAAGPGGPASPGGQKPISPEDAPVLLLSSRPSGQGTGEPGHEATGPSGLAGQGGHSAAPDPMGGTRRNLEAYQRQLQGLMDSLGQGASLAGQGGPAALNTALAPMTGPSALSARGNTGGTGGSASGLFGGELGRSSTPRVSAGQLGDRNLVLPKGTSFTCALKTRVVSATSGFIGCQVQRNVYSDNGRVLLIERGSHLDGEYRMTTVRPGTVRIPVLWTRLRTPNGVTVDIDSPGTGPLGESGIDGHVDNRWGERIGAALLLSVIDDAVRLVIQNQSSDGGGNTVILQSTTSNSSKLAEKVLDSTINIPPLIYQHQGGIVGIYVARDVDFASVYQLEATGSGPGAVGIKGSGTPSPGATGSGASESEVQR